jgi:hypothetical protein
MTERWEITQTNSDVVEVKCFRDDFQVYKFGAGHMTAAVSLLGGKIHALRHLPVGIHSRADVHRDVIGREIFYREIPAIIIDFDGENGRVRVRSDHPAYCGFHPEPWDDPLGEHAQDIWEDLLSPRIHWHRDTA